MFKEKFYNRVCLLSAVSVFLLFVLGGLVRSTGSGMGCPDWPKCFGKIIPPIDESQLPENYKKQFLEKRLKKAERFTKLLNNLGFNELAEKVKNDPGLKIAHPYNRKTAYIEWTNRLFGVLTGVFAILALISGFGRRNENRKAFGWAIFGFFWVVFNGWLGSVVVDTNLIPGIVTAHYAAAYLAFAGFIFALSGYPKYHIGKFQYRFLIFIIVLLFVEIFLGTTTREIIDALKQKDQFELKIETVWIPGYLFLTHRILGIGVFILNIVLLYTFKRSHVAHQMSRLQAIVVFLLILQVASGFANVIYNIPALINVVHISASAAVVGLQLWIIKNRLKAGI